ncbi:MAG: PadR family transcriptional regulator [Candidatus Micrarchaeota archaeon]
MRSTADLKGVKAVLPPVAVIEIEGCNSPTPLSFPIALFSAGVKSLTYHAIDMSTASNVELGFLQMQVLWLLSKGSQHGYALMRELSRLKGCRVGQGALYPALARLVKAKLIHIVSRGARGRMSYGLTPAGRRTAARFCREFVSVYRGIFFDYCCKACGKR